MMDTTEATKLNAVTFKKEMSWVSDKIDQRLDLFFEKGDLDHKKFYHLILLKIKVSMLII